MLESSPLPSPSLELLDSSSDSSTDVLVIAIAPNGSTGKTFDQVNDQGDGWLTRLVERKLMTGSCGDVVRLASITPDGPAMILGIGVGNEEERSISNAYQCASTAIREVVGQPCLQIDVALGEAFDDSMDSAIVAGALNACENQAIYHCEPATDVPERIRFAGVSAESIKRGEVIGASVITTRRLVNEPAAMIYPESFADRATELGQSVGLDVEVWDEKKLSAEGCRAILAVGAGSSRPPRLVMLRHNGGGDEAPIALVGKGVTFDSGGLSLKPSDGMADMKCDMAGAATVVGVMQAISRLGIKRNVIGFCGLAENMVSGDSYKLGDVIETRSGKTIEILNTDAEGRVVLSDTLDVAIQHEPTAIVDLATLTGACMVALGVEVAGLMTNNPELCKEIEAAAERQGEPVWQLPMFKLYDEKVKSKVADIKNIGEGRWGGAITAAKFLENFVDNTPWVHIDIAGPAFADSPKPHRDAGATGAMVRSLIDWLEQ